MPEELETNGAAAGTGASQQTDPAAAAAAAAEAGQNAGDQAAKQAVTLTEPNGQQQAVSPFAELPDEATRTWLEKRGVKDIQSLAKLAFEQDKFTGGAIKVPGKDATPEEREAFYNRLGRPEKADGYDFKPPAELPEDIPYDGERAKAFASKAHTLGLTKDQAAALHDWYVKDYVDAYQSMDQDKSQQTVAQAQEETKKLEKLWGPLDGQQMKTQLAYADRALRDVGGSEVLAEFQRVGLVGSEGNMILSAPIAAMMAKFGAAVYKEDDVLRGNPAMLNNPFEEGAHFNVTAQMRLVKQDLNAALNMIAAAGKKPSDFGLKD